MSSILVSKEAQKSLVDSDTTEVDEVLAPPDPPLLALPPYPVLPALAMFADAISFYTLSKPLVVLFIFT